MGLIDKFIASVAATHSKGNATEHSYRPALQALFDGLNPQVTALNEPKREKVGAPDFALMRDGIVIGHCEAKDLHVDLKAMKDANVAQKGPRHCPRYPRRMGDAYLRSNGLE